MDKFAQECNKLGEVINVKLQNGQLIDKFAKIKKSKKVGINIMDRVLQIHNPALALLKPVGFWAVHKIKTAFDQ